MHDQFKVKFGQFKDSKLLWDYCFRYYDRWFYILPDQNQDVISKIWMTPKSLSQGN